ncbi:hypothetical protein [Maridesulfovibrio sp.]|uniref:hypothetical protein n=1 Tax=Maridesulfovibrio sp. TaxID=2795000 RepID=UPI0029CAA663|nr:hypothetical protein [Maridesulfovibrio sp.]
MDNISLATPVEGGVQDTGIETWLPTERPDAAPDGIDVPTLHQHDAEQQRITDNAIHSLTGKGNLIDRII